MDNININVELAWVICICSPSAGHTQKIIWPANVYIYMDAVS